MPTDLVIDALSGFWDRSRSIVDARLRRSRVLVRGGCYPRLRFSIVIGTGFSSAVDDLTIGLPPHLDPLGIYRRLSPSSGMF